MSALDEIRGRLEAATSGPWEKDAHGTAKLDSIVFKAYSDKPGGWIEVARSYGADTEFIAHAPTDVARLLADVQNVLNLHAPRTEGSDAPYCRHCYSPPYGHAPYPCPTAQCITAALEATP